MNADELTTTWQAYKADPNRVTLRNRLAEHYRHLVQTAAERIARNAPRSVDVDDLAGEGMFGLFSAIEDFDLERGIKFEAYSALRIRGAIIDSIREADWVPRLIRLRAAKLEHATAALHRQLRRPPTDDELAQRLQLSAAELDAWRTEVQVVKVESCDQLAFPHAESGRAVSSGDLEPHKRTPAPSSRLERAELLRIVARGLSRSERLILILLYFEELTMKEVGATLGISESRISQMHSALIERLQQKLQSRRRELHALARA